MLSTPFHKYGCIRTPLHPLQRRCTPSPYATVRLSRTPCWRGAATLSVRPRIYEMEYLAFSCPQAADIPCPLLFLTIAVMCALTRMLWKTSTFLLSGCRNSEPEKSLNGMRFTFAWIPLNKCTSLVASSGVSLTPFRRTYSKVTLLPAGSGNLRHASNSDLRG